jgi:hypothetical protein
MNMFPGMREAAPHTIRSMASVARVAFSRAPAMRLASRRARASCSQRLSRSCRLYHGHEPAPMERDRLRATTILSVRKGAQVVGSSPRRPSALSAHGYERQVVMGDGQVSMGPMIVKNNVMKLRRLGGGVVVGMAGASFRPAVRPVQCAGAL